MLDNPKIRLSADKSPSTINDDVICSALGLLSCSFPPPRKMILKLETCNKGQRLGCVNHFSKAPSGHAAKLTQPNLRLSLHTYALVERNSGASRGILSYHIGDLIGNVTHPRSVYLFRVWRMSADCNTIQQRINNAEDSTLMRALQSPA